MQRYVLNTNKEIIRETFGVESDSDALYKPCFNVLPGSVMPVIIKKTAYEIHSGTWGTYDTHGEQTYYLSAAEYLKNGGALAENKNNPCIIPASGFYEWKKTVRDPLPFYVRLLNQPVLGIAGFYRQNPNHEEHDDFCFTMLTVPANVLLKPLTETMPCLLAPDEFGTWLNGNVSEVLNKKIYKTELIPDLAVYRVSDMVNDPSQNSIDLIQPIPKLREDE